MDLLDDAVTVFIYVIGGLTAIGMAITAVAMIAFAFLAMLDGLSLVRDYFADLRDR